MEGGAAGGWGNPGALQDHSSALIVGNKPPASSDPFAIAGCTPLACHPMSSHIPTSTDSPKDKDKEEVVEEVQEELIDRKTVKTKMMVKKLIKHLRK